MSSSALAHTAPAQLIAQLLREQQDLSAVERFSIDHDGAELPSGARWRHLIPSEKPEGGEQYAFEVDLDDCTGCKSCVTACHNLNGLEHGESWRSVGLLHGGAGASPFLQTVTTACHHCVDPACMRGCPVGAYDKDPITGIVEHLDDQCIGCQYCVLMCPYEVPRYSQSRGIVRKCNMCRPRLQAQEAPACAQACPNEAIRISVVSEREVIEEVQTGWSLPGTPDPLATLPTTRYRSRKPIPANAIPADYYAARRERAHPPLVIMLVLTQLAVGALVVGYLIGSQATFSGLQPIAAFGALGLATAAMGASTLHLGRPQLAYRALIGLRASWLSREILAFGIFSGLTALYAATFVLDRADDRVGLAAAICGALGVWCSVMVYAATRRATWSARATAIRFGSTTLILGTSAALATALIAAAAGTIGSGPVRAELVPALSLVVVGVTVVQLLWEGMQLLSSRDRHNSSRKQTALLMLGDLRDLTLARFYLGAVGGVVTPLILLAIAPNPEVGGLALTVFACIGVAFSLIAELIGRHLFFVAAAAPRMPGGMP